MSNSPAALTSQIQFEISCILEDNTVTFDKWVVQTFMAAAVTKQDKHTRTFQSFVQLIFKGCYSDSDSVQLNWEIPRVGDMVCRGEVQVRALEGGQMVWSLFRGQFSQTSWPWWLTFGALGDSSLLQPKPRDDYRESHHSSNRHSIITYGSTVHRCPSVCLSLMWVRPAI